MATVEMEAVADPPKAPTPAVAAILAPINLLLALAAFTPAMFAYAHFVGWLGGQTAYLVITCVAAFLLGFVRLQVIPKADSGPIRVWLPTWVASLALLALGLFLLRPAWTAPATVLFGLALSLSWGGWPFVRALAPAWCMLLFPVIPTLFADNPLVFEFRALTGRIASKILDYFAVMHRIDGELVHLGDLVVPLASFAGGTSAIFGGLVGGWFVFFVAYRPWYFSVVLAILIAYWTLLGQIVQIAIGIDLLAGYGPEVLSGWSLMLLEWLTAAGIFLLILSTDRLLAFFVQFIAGITMRFNVRRKPARSAIETYGVKRVAMKHRWPSLRTAGPLANWTLPIYAAAVAGQVLAIFLLWNQWQRAHVGPELAIEGLTEYFLPHQRFAGGRWAYRDFNHREYTHRGGWTVQEYRWRFQHLFGCDAALTVEFPLRGFESPRADLIEAGWTILDERVALIDLGDDFKMPVPSIEAESKLRQKVLVFYQIFDLTGQPMEFPHKDKFVAMEYALAGLHDVPWLLRKGPATCRVSLAVHLFSGEIEPDDLVRIRKLYLNRADLISKVLAGDKNVEDLTVTVGADGRMVPMATLPMAPSGEKPKSAATIGIDSLTESLELTRPGPAQPEEPAPPDSQAPSPEDP